MIPLHDHSVVVPDIIYGLVAQAAGDGRGDVRARGLARGAHAGVHVQQDGRHRGAARAAGAGRGGRGLPRHAAQQGAHPVSICYISIVYIWQNYTCIPLHG